MDRTTIGYLIAQLSLVLVIIFGLFVAISIFISDWASASYWGVLALVNAVVLIVLVMKMNGKPLKKEG